MMSEASRNTFLLFIFLFSLIAASQIGPNLDGTEDRASQSSDKLKPTRIDWFRQNDSSDIRYLKSDFCQLAVSAIGGEMEQFKVCLNSEGFRDGNISQDDPDVRVVALGDAVTFGVGVNNSQPWPQQLERKLDSRREYSSQVLNFGFPFKSTREEVIWFNDTIRHYDPDIVVLQYLENDPQNLTRVDELQEQLERNDTENILSPRIERERAIQIEKEERSNMSIEEEMEAVDRYLEELDRISRQDDIEIVLLYYQTGPVDRQLEYMRNKARSNNWDFVASEAYNPENTIHDSFYLTPSGHDVMAEEVLPYVLNLSDGEIGRTKNPADE